MRIAFVNTLLKIAKKNHKVMLITGDLGFSVFESFQKSYPQQFLDAGVAEQNMTGLAAGLAIEGKIPFLYSIVPFVTMRNFEQIRNDICYQNLNIKIVGVGAGFSYGIHGHTHFGLEDIALMRVLPNMAIFSPGDPIEVTTAVELAMKIKGPVYIRLGKAGEPILHKKLTVKSFREGIVMQKGKDIVIFATGALLAIAVEVSKQLSQNNLSVKLVSVPMIKPLDIVSITKHMTKAKLILSIEEHSKIGGLGTAIAEVIAENGFGIPLVRFGADDKFHKKIGSQSYMRKKSGLDIDAIVERTVKKFKSYE